MENVLGSELWEAHELGPVTEEGLLSFPKLCLQTSFVFSANSVNFGTVISALSGPHPPAFETGETTFIISFPEALRGFS